MSNDLLYYSVKDLATTLNATLTVKPGTIELSYKNKKAYFDLKAKDTLIQDGVAYAPISQSQLSCFLVLHAIIA